MYYFDHSATTPVHPDVLDLMHSIQKDVYGNPSSVHSQGRKPDYSLRLPENRWQKLLAQFQIKLFSQAAVLKRITRYLVVIKSK